jgi:shikimate dehydrogenase
VTDRLLFLGVTTAGSSIMGLFPAWARLLGLDAMIAGRDLPLGADPRVYRRAVEELRDDPSVRGALVTTHKVAIHDHAADLFGELDRWARLCGEVSSISKRGGLLVGHAKDPITSGMALRAILGPAWWQDHPRAEVLCLGAGGAGAAIVAHLLSQPGRPARVTITSRRPERLDLVRRIARQLGGDRLLAGRVVSAPQESDVLLEALPPASLVINATGAGKDRPGSPLGDEARFPDQAVAWDLNYRGELRFLEQARAQLPPSRVHDGWRYFLHGWTEVIAEVFGLEMTAERFERLARAAESARPRDPGS